jgi:hypothetical protein
VCSDTPGFVLVNSGIWKEKEEVQGEKVLRQVRWKEEEKKAG